MYSISLTIPSSIPFIALSAASVPWSRHIPQALSRHAQPGLSLMSVITFRGSNLIVERNTQPWFSLWFEDHTVMQLCVCQQPLPAAEEYPTCVSSPKKKKKINKNYRQMLSRLRSWQWSFKIRWQQKNRLSGMYESKKKVWKKDNSSEKCPAHTPWIDKDIKKNIVQSRQWKCCRFLPMNALSHWSNRIWWQNLRCTYAWHCMLHVIQSFWHPTTRWPSNCMFMKSLMYWG